MKHRRRSSLALIAVVNGVVGCHPDFARYSPLELRSTSVPKGTLTARFMGVTTLLLDDGQTAIMTDGFFSRPGLVSVLFSRIEPDPARIADALSRIGRTPIAAVMVAHSHYDHALDSARVAQLTDALLLGSESTLNIGRGLGLPTSQMHAVKGR